MLGKKKCKKVDFYLVYVKEIIFRRRVMRG